MKSELDWGPIHVDGGKYTFQPADDGYSVDILRYGNPWFTVTQGCNAVRALAFEVEALRETIAPRQAVFPAAAVRRGPVNQLVVMRSRADLSKFSLPVAALESHLAFEPKRDPLAACTGCYYLVTESSDTPHCDDLHGTHGEGEFYYITDPTKPPPEVCPIRKKI